MWSLGTIVYELLVGFPPFTGLDKKSLAKNIKKGIYKFPKHIQISMGCLDFINKCLMSDPSKRMHHEDILDHPWISGKGTR